MIATAHAEVIELNSGAVIKGQIVEQTEDYIKVDTGVGVKVTYFVEEIKAISEDVGIEINEAVVSPVPLAPDTEKKKAIHSKPEASSPFAAKLPTSSSEDVPKAIKTRVQSTHPKIEKITSSQEDPEEKNVPEQADSTSDSYIISQIGSKTKEFTQTAGEYTKDIREKAGQYTGTLKDKFTETFPDLGSDSTKYFNMLKRFPDQKDAFLPFLYVNLLLYCLFCFPFMLLALKFRLNPLLAWIPIVQIFLFIKMANRSYASVFLLLIPIVNLFVIISMWFKILDLLQKPKFFGILMILPGINLITLWYLGLSKNK